MSSTLRCLAIGGLLSLMASSLCTGCVDDKSTLFIQGVIHREAPTCLAQPDPSAVMMGSGTLDVALATDYFATFLVGNQLTPRGDKTQMRTETTQVILRKATISLTRPGGDQVGQAFTVAGSGAAPPNSGADPGWGLFSAVVIPASTLGVSSTRGADEIDVHIKIRGQTTGGQDVESGEFVFPVHICYGCLVTYPLSALVTDAGVTTCSAASDTVLATGCSFGQDDPVDCRSCTSIDICRTVQ